MSSLIKEKDMTFIFTVTLLKYLPTGTMFWSQDIQFRFKKWKRKKLTYTINAFKDLEAYSISEMLFSF
jgi:hypothetical protein